MSARQRILDAAYELFSRHGVRAVGVDRIIARAGVAKKTFYRHFGSKADLAVAFVDLRGLRWTRDWLEAEAYRRASRPRERVLALFDALDEWFHREDFEGDALLAVAFEVRDPGDPVHQAAVRELGEVRQIVLDIVSTSGVADPAAVASEVHLLLLGAVAAATAGGVDAARVARALASRVLDARGLR